MSEQIYYRALVIIYRHCTFYVIKTHVLFRLHAISTRFLSFDLSTEKHPRTIGRTSNSFRPQNVHTSVRRPQVFCQRRRVNYYYYYSWPTVLTETRHIFPKQRFVQMRFDSKRYSNEIVSVIKRNDPVEFGARCL